MSSTPRATSSGPKRALVIAVLASLALHALGFVSVRGLLQLPKLDLELTLPSEAEFGVVDQPDPPEPPAPPPSPEPAKPQPTTSEPAAAAPKPPAPKPAKPNPVPSVLADAGQVAALAPHGTQLALRLDVERIRATPLADDVGALLDALPDVRALLEGSGVSPLRDLSRLFLASPDLRREHVVMAGRYIGEARVAREAVERLAAARGMPAEWRTQRGVTLAPWFNQDATPRVIALLGPELFAIARESDLPRVLRVARTLAQRSHNAEHASEGDALVAMGERELLHISIDNARSFVRGARVEQTPERLQLSVSSSEDAAQLELRIDAHFPDAPQAESARRFWNDVLTRYAANPMLALIGFDGLLRAAQLTQDEAELRTQLNLPEQQARLILRFARDSLHGPRPAAARANP